jgi:glucoamylase
MDPFERVDGAADGEAPGRPGLPPTWTSSRKDAVGTALGPSRVWFTVGHGIVNEVYWPHVDRPQIRDLGFLVADDAGFWTEAKRLPDRLVNWLGPGIPAVRSEFRHPRFGLRLRICTDRDRDVLLIEASLDARAEGLRLYPLLAPHLGRSGADNSAWLVESGAGLAIVAERRPYALALVADPAPERGSVGFVGVSDGWQDFARNGRLTWTYGSAEGGNVAGMLEIRPQGQPIRLALGFGERPAQALVTAIASLGEPFEAHWTRYAANWRGRGRPPTGTRRPAPVRPSGVSARAEDCYERSLAVIRAHEDRVTRGAIAASLSIPWGDTSDDPGGYHLIWSRDLVEAAGALLAAGDLEAAARTFVYLAASQRPDGSWPQNQWIDGTAYWRGAQLDEIAFPVLLARQLRDAGCLDPTGRRPPLVDPELATRSVARALTAIARNGPATGQDRWEEDAGLAPATLGPVIAALVAGADFLAGTARDSALALADDWNANLERWTYAAGSPLARRYGVAGTYVRIAPADVLVGGGLDAPVAVRNRPAPADRVPAAEMVSPDVLALVRFGLRQPDDPRIVETLAVVDATLRIDTPAGPVWRRYSGDGYGETEDGGPFRGIGLGRGWPLLTGERGHYVVAAGGDARPYLAAMAAMAGDAGLIPEQVWDGPPRPDLGLFPGQATGSARPLVWAHAEFIKLYRSILTGVPVDRPPAVIERWGGRRPTTSRRSWRLSAPIPAIERGETLRIELLEPAVVHISTDGWATVRDLPARDTGLGLWVLDVEPAAVGEGAAIVFTLHWTTRDTWEGRDFTVLVRPAGDRPA